MSDGITATRSDQPQDIRRLYGTVRIRGGRARLQLGRADRRRLGFASLLLNAYPIDVPDHLDESEQLWAAVTVFRPFRNRRTAVQGTLFEGVLYSATFAPSRLRHPGRDMRLDRGFVAHRVKQILRKDSGEIAARLADVGILTASAFYHRLRNYAREVEVFSDYLRVPKTRIEEFLEVMERDRRNQALVSAAPRIPVTRGVNVSRIAEVTGGEPREHAPSRPLPLPRPEHTEDLPTSIDSRRFVPAARNQGNQRGACVAFTGVGMMESELIRRARTAGPDYDGPRFNRALHLSEQYLYWACKELDGAREEEGSFLEFAVQALREGVPEDFPPGVCRAGVWPYEQEKLERVGQGPPRPKVKRAEMWHAARAKKLKPTSPAEIKATLAAGHCVGLSVYTYHFWEDHYAWREGVISLPLSIEFNGAHAILLVGYEDRPETPHGDGEFLFKNSWGREWGKRGFGRLPYRYLLSEGIEAWALEL